MTREERLSLLKQIEKDIHVCSLKSTFLEDAKSCAIRSVIEELEQEPTTKNDLVTLTFSKGTLKYSCKDYVIYKKDWLRSHYGAEIDIMFGDSQYKEPTTKNDLEVDAVSRQAVHDMLENLPITVEDKWFNWLQKACMRLADLPSVTPQEPKSEWEQDHAILKAYSDGANEVLDKIKEEIKDNTYFINETTEKEGIDFETVEKIIDKYKGESA